MECGFTLINFCRFVFKREALGEMMQLRACALEDNVLLHSRLVPRPGLGVQNSSAASNQGLTRSPKIKQVTWTIY